jgi:hypothetical protein
MPDQYTKIPEEEIVQLVRNAGARIILVGLGAPGGAIQAFMERLRDIENLKYAAIIGSDREEVWQAYRCLDALDWFHEENRRASLELRREAAEPTGGVVLFDDTWTVAYSPTPIEIRRPASAADESVNGIIYPGGPESFLRTFAGPPEPDPEEFRTKLLEGIIRKIADSASKKIARKVIRLLQKMPAGNSGDDSGLKSQWEELVVQVQGEQSILWEFYDETVDSYCDEFFSELPQHERDAIWIQTDTGSDESEDIPHFASGDLKELSSELWAGTAGVSIFSYDKAEIAAHLKQYVYEEAGRWNNKRILDYLDRQVLD